MDGIIVMDGYRILQYKEEYNEECVTMGNPEMVYQNHKHYSVMVHDSALYRDRGGLYPQ